MAPLDEVLGRGSPRQVQLRKWGAMQMAALGDGNDVTFASPDTRLEEHPAVAPPATAAVSEAAVFWAMQRKNWTLKTRGLIKCCSGECPPALPSAMHLLTLRSPHPVAEILVPLIFLGLLCLPRYLIADVSNPATLYSPRPLSDLSWSGHPPTGGAYKLFYAPNTSAETVQVAEMAAKELVCSTPSFMRTVALASSFTVDTAAIAAAGVAQRCLTNVAACEQYIVPRPGGLPLTSPLISGDLTAMCAPACLASRACFHPWLSDFLSGFPSEGDAVAAATDPGAVNTVAAVVVLPPSLRSDTLQYVIRTNASDVPGTSQFGSSWASVAFNQWVVGPINDWADYWAFLNIQRAFDTALVSLNTQPTALQAGLLKLSGAADVELETRVKAFPYLPYSTNLGGSFAALFFGLIFTFSFLISVVIMLKSLIMEKELRIREAMQMMGLRSSVYWLSWFVTHYGTLVLVATLMACIGTYPFKHSAGALMWAFYLVWCFQLVAFTYALSCTFSTSKIAAVAGSLLYILTWAPAVAVVSGKGSLGNSGWTGVCIFPASSIYMFGVAVALLENAEVGVTPASLFTNLISPEDSAGSGTFSAGAILLVTLGSGCFYAALAAYLDLVMPRQFGTVLPWNFPLRPSFWRAALLRAPAAAAGSSSAPAQGDVAGDALIGGACEEPPDGMKTSLSLRRLTKAFPTTDGKGTVMAVTGLSLDFHEGHISSLLGHNGAGKTTTLSILCGLLPPTGGTASVAGWDVGADMARIRTSLGVCPQHDVLWPTLTCTEHLQLFAQFRGVAKAKAPAMALEMLAAVGMRDMATAAAGTLSGGQKRKLSLAIAFIGGPAVVLLDEPTTGMDPFSRRSAWDFIRSQKAGRSIVLTTHFMDEADILSDRLAIMTAGRLACLGSPIYLKSRLGLGYHLTILLPATSGAEAAEELGACVAAHVPGALCESHVGAELSFLLPPQSVAAFPPLLRHLDDRGIGYGVSCSTLEEVFLNIAESSTVLAGGGVTANQLRDMAVERKRAAKELRKMAATGKGAEAGAGVQPRSAGWRLVLQQFHALLRKRALNARRDRLGWATMYVVPLFFVALGLGLCHIGTGDSEYPGAVLGRVYLGNKPMAGGTSGGGDTAALAGAFSPGAVTWRNDATALWSCTANGTSTNTQLSALAASFGVSLGTVACQPSVTDCAALGCTAPGTATAATLDAFLLATTQSHKNCRQEGPGAPCGAVFVDRASQAGRSFGMTIATSPTAYHVLPAAQSAADSAVYSLLLGRPGSLSVVNHPLPASRPPAQGPGVILNMLAGLCVVLALGSLSASASVFLVAEKRAHSTHLALVSGVGKGTFWAATLAWDLLNYMLPLALFTAAFAASQVQAYTDGGALGVIFLLLLLFGLSAMPLAYLLHFPSSDEMNALAGQMGLYFFFGIAQLIAAVVLQGLAALGKARGVWSTLQILFRWLPHYNVGIVLFKLSQNQAQPSYAQLSPWHKDISGTELKVMLVEAFVFSTLTLCVDFNLLLRLEQLGLRLLALLHTGEAATAADDESSDDDQDVASERHRIVESGGDAGDLLTMQDMRKTYRGGKQAVRGVTIGVPEGSCFGLLGLNGAGKSTTFKMLTGEEALTRGDALVRGRAGSAAGEHPCSVVHELVAVRQRIGLCPQEDALCARLTCREHVLLYAAIRGLSPAGAAQLSDELLSKLGLKKWTHALAGTLSGGNKRKLSASIALVGDPPLALYDEPSSGMDPEARRSMWDVLATTMAGRATVLTTHVLAEAEALCHSVGIMVAGRLRCLGSLTHLKQTHGSGYTLEVRCNPANAGRVATSLASALPSARLQEEQEGRLTYALPTAQRLGDAFDALEALRSTPAVGVQDFSVTQSSLEQIFIGFASTCQEGVKRGSAGRGKARRIEEEADGELQGPGVECPSCKAVLRWRAGASVMRCGACQALVGLPHVVDGQHYGEGEA